jgi:molybdopterin converting factor small subunit
VGEVLGDLTNRFPGIAGQVWAEEGKLNRFVNVYLNDDDVRYLDQLDTKVHDSDAISILPAVAGGSGATTGGTAWGPVVTNGSRPAGCTPRQTPASG